MPRDCGFGALLPSCSKETATAAADAAALKNGIERLPTSDAWPPLAYGIPGAEPIVAGFDRHGEWLYFVAYPIPEVVFAQVGPDKLSGFLRDVCEQTGAALGRSYKEGAHAAATEREAEGEIEYLEWFQYFGTAIVARWGLQRLKDGPFHRVEVLPSGACAIWLWDSPFDQREAESTKRAAEYLGITLRPHFIRDSSGKQVKLNWP